VAKLFSLEAIDYQVNDTFVDEGEKLIQVISDNINNKTYVRNKEVLRSKEFLKLLDLIHKRFNIQLEVHEDYSEYSEAGVWIFHDAFLGFDAYNEYAGSKLTIDSLKTIALRYKHAIQTDSKKEGYIDFSKARVYGYFTKIPVVATFNFMYLIDYCKYTPREILAIVLHEIGHVFVGFEFHHRLNTTNTSLMNAIEAINKKDYSTVKYVLARDWNMSDFDEKVLNDPKARYDLVGELAVKIANNIGSEFMNSVRDYTSVEAGADDFATRFMLQRELASVFYKTQVSIDKLLNPFGAKYSVVGDLIGIIFGLVALVAVSFFAGINPIAFITTMLLIGAIFDFIFIEEDLNYDNPPDRINRIALNLVNSLKNTKLPTELIKKKIAEYDIIKAMVKNTMSMPHNNNTSVLNTYIIEKLPFYRKKFQYKDMQKLTEELLNNPLFVAAKKLELA
jgi:hypothetical protein